MMSWGRSNLIAETGTILGEISSTGALILR